MKDFVIKCSAQSEQEGDTEPGYLTLRLGPNRNCGDNTFTVAERLARAAGWVMDLDAQCRDLIHAGRSPQVSIPAASNPRAGRVQRETSADHRKLQLGIGGLIRPLLLDPPELKEPYPFQRRGAEWLRDQRSAILADDTGLGKTAQVIAAMRLLFNRAMLRSALVVCPKGLVATWERELGRWAPELGVAILTPPAQVREDAWKAVAGRSHVLLTNYEQLRHPPRS